MTGEQALKCWALLRRTLDGRDDDYALYDKLFDGIEEETEARIKLSFAWDD